MSLTTSAITGRVPMPNNIAPLSGSVTFTLVGYDTQGVNVVPSGASATFNLADDGNLPAGARLWRNTAGLRGTVYLVTVRWREAGSECGELKENTLGHVQVQNAPSYTVPQLLNAVPPDAQPGQWWSAITQAQYDEMIAAVALVDADRVAAESAAARAEAAADFQSLPALLAYTAAIPVGSYVVTKAEGYRYQVVSTGHHLTTAGGVLIKVLPIGGEYHVDAFNTGIGDNTAAFQSAIDELPAVGGVIWLSKSDYSVIGPLNTGGKKVLWRGGSRINGQVYPSIPGIFEGYDAQNARRVVSRMGAGAAEFVQQDYHRVTGYGAAADGVDTLLRAFTIVSAESSTIGANPRDEWPFQARVDNYSDSINGVANTGQARRYGKGAVWSGHFNTYDYTDATASDKAVWGIECNIQADGPDSPQLLRRIGAFLGHSISAIYEGLGVNVIGQGVLIQPASADMQYGLRLFTGINPGVTGGEFLSAALRIDAKAPDLIAAINPSSTGVVKIGADLSAGILSNILGQGRNAIGGPVSYSSIRTSISDSTSGSEGGSLGLHIMAAGSLREMIRLTANSGVQIYVGGTLRTINIGAVDSGGTGQRLLTVAN